MFKTILRVWIVTILCVLLLSSCDFESPEVKFASQIKVWSVNGKGYDRVKLNGEIVSRCEVDSVAAFCYDDGSLIEAGGLEFTPDKTVAEYLSSNSWYPTGGAGVVSSFVTEDSGYCKFTSWCTFWGVQTTHSGMTASGRRSASVCVAAGGFTNYQDPRTGFRMLIPWYERTFASDFGWIYGGHYLSGGPDFSGNVSPEEVICQRPESAQAMLSESDGLFLADSSLESAEAITVHAADWCKRSGPAGHGFSIAVDNLVAVNHTNPTILTYRSAPYFLSVQAVLSEPVPLELEGMSLSCTLLAGDTEKPICSVVRKISPDGRRVIVQSDYLIPIDRLDWKSQDAPESVYDRWTASLEPNDPSLDIYAPAFPDDPNLYTGGIYTGHADPNRFVPVHCFAIDSGQTIRIEFTQDSVKTSDIPLPLVLYAAENWLTGNLILDRNQDGIVNLKDL